MGGSTANYLLLAEFDLCRWCSVIKRPLPDTTEGRVQSLQNSSHFGGNLLFPLFLTPPSLIFPYHDKGVKTGIILWQNPNPNFNQMSNWFLIKSGAIYKLPNRCNSFVVYLLRMF
jgi:hypothetical protein